VVLVQVAEDLFIGFMVLKVLKDLCYAPPVFKDLRASVKDLCYAPPIFKDLCRLPLRKYAMRRRRLLHRRSINGAVCKVV
jgi:hypothetical protein